MREDLFRLIDAVFQKRERENLDVESQFYLERKHQEFVRNGLGINQVKRNRLADIRRTQIRK